MIYDQNAYKSVNYKRVYSKANEYLALAPSITGFPFKVKEFIYEQSDIRLCSFKKAKEKYGIYIPMFGSESAIIQELEGAYIIFYNQEEPDYRVRFSIMHEYGHYILGHKMNLEDSDTLYHTQELEANCFAAQLLMPEQLLRECLNRCKSPTIEFITDSFDVSADAAKKRRNTLANTTYEWRSREEAEFDDIILMRYAQKLNEIAPKPPEYAYYDFESENDRQLERDSWLDTRSRWN
ncbi:MAG: ImmA/IrrE family metallo-endopeptidase [Lachnospiraceae bacterium]|nr:ImmA/IrrE family metallo-endopeptidase [Lachnospiraceae bacterium]